MTTANDILGKYKDADGVANAIVHKDNHIGTLETENAQLRDALAQATAGEQKAVTTAQTLDTLLSVTNEQPNEDEPANHAPGNDSDNGSFIEDMTNNDNSNDITPTPDIDALIEQRLQERDASTVAQTNYAETNRLLEASFGDAAGKALQTAMASSGINQETLKLMAETAPASVLALVNGATKTDLTSNPTNPRALNTEAVAATLKATNDATSGTAYQQDMVRWKNASKADKQRITDEMLDKLGKQGAEAYGVRTTNV